MKLYYVQNNMERAPILPSFKSSRVITRAPMLYAYVYMETSLTKKKGGGGGGGWELCHYQI